MYLTSDDVRNNLKAGPGWVVIEPVKAAAEVKTKGGLIVPQNENLTSRFMDVGRVVSCGEHYHQQSGATHFKGWPLKPGSYVYYHPHSPWSLRSVEGGESEFMAIKSIDVIGYWE